MDYHWKLVADSSGSISSTVRIPLGATSFSVRGTKVSMVFLNALGAGQRAPHAADVAVLGLARHDSQCGSVAPLPFGGFDHPLVNAPRITTAKAGSTIPVKFSLPGIDATLPDVLAPGYPQSAPVSCATPGSITIGTPTQATSQVGKDNGGTAGSDHYLYNWQTARSWSGCRELVVKLVDGSYHRAVVNFSPHTPS